MPRKTRRLPLRPATGRPRSKRRDVPRIAREDATDAAGAPMVRSSARAKPAPRLPSSRPKEARLRPMSRPRLLPDPVTAGPKANRGGAAGRAGVGVAGGAAAADVAIATGPLLQNNGRKRRLRPVKKLPAGSSQRPQRPQEVAPGMKRQQAEQRRKQPQGRLPRQRPRSRPRRHDARAAAAASRPAARPKTSACRMK